MTPTVIFAPLIDWQLVVGFAVVALALVALALWRGLAGPLIIDRPIDTASEQKCCTMRSSKPSRASRAACSCSPRCPPRA